MLSFGNAENTKRFQFFMSLDGWCGQGPSEMYMKIFQVLEWEAMTSSQLVSLIEDMPFLSYLTSQSFSNLVDKCMCYGWYSMNIICHFLYVCINKGINAIEMLIY